MAGSVECRTVIARVADTGSATRVAGATACRDASRARRSSSLMCRTHQTLAASSQWIDVEDCLLPSSSAWSSSR